jgi:UDP-glucose 4-epimerase
MPSRARVLVTGGAGYIGSHVVLRLAAAGHEVVVLDNLSSGHAWAVLGGELVIADLADRPRLEALLEERRFDALMHFAASIWVAESMREPVKYYSNNTVNALGLFAAAARQGVPLVVFSSTAAVYGQPDVDPIDETTPLAPINPYGASKMMAERMLADIAAVAGMRTAVLRYFNVAGADPAGRIGEATPDNSHLVKVACEVAMGLREQLVVNGTDYPTPDGTCIRDYIHVDDLAAAHVAALDYLLDGGPSTVLNCGYGHGTSVREVLEAVAEVSGVDLPITHGPRRPGDPARLVAATDRIRQVLGWRPQHDDLRRIVDSAWRWEQELARRRSAAAGREGT